MLYRLILSIYFKLANRLFFLVKRLIPFELLIPLSSPTNSLNKRQILHLCAIAVQVFQLCERVSCIAINALQSALSTGIFGHYPQYLSVLSASLSVSIVHIGNIVDAAKNLFSCGKSIYYNYSNDGITKEIIVDHPFYCPCEECSIFHSSIPAMPSHGKVLSEKRQKKREAEIRKNKKRKTKFIETRQLISEHSHVFCDRLNSSSNLPESLFTMSSEFILFELHGYISPHSTPCDLEVKCDHSHEMSSSVDLHTGVEIFDLL
ncbi:hypothetical protein ADUPG1_010864 [Aduncisulcus paluster]|uniref:Uncharacterized protein n=1 Tax=Aduncisulcus paluster TaxID=2918883 RepID=A0ABQ5JT65_9EUKA|nr:hypothetical protein ADUPG1_010864 [Aduncisulcus paluster]